MLADPTADFAIVAGITHYASLKPLSGPENDAKQFYDWVTTTGGVSKSRAQYLWSSTYSGSGGGTTDKPDHFLIDAAFQKLVDLSLAQCKSGLHPRIGRRLYVYLAGHGFAPGDDFNRVLALLTANFDEHRDREGYVPAPLYQKQVGASGAFDEILLFMDCCGSKGYRPYPRIPFHPDEYEDHDPRFFFAAAAKPGKITRETTVMRGGMARGVFSLALEDALSGRAVQHSEITTTNLAGYLRRHMLKLIDPGDLKDRDVSRSPHIESEPQASNFVLFNNIPAVQSRVTFRVNASLVKRPYEISSDGSNVVARGVTTDSFDHHFETGVFKLKVDGRFEVGFDVTGDMHVSVG
jgi:hypothetical protein